MKLVDLGELMVSPQVRALMLMNRLDTAPYLFDHSHGSSGDLQSAEDIFKHITAVCRGQTVRSVHDTRFGALQIMTISEAPRHTVLAFNEELRRAEFDRE